MAVKSQLALQEEQSDGPLLKFEGKYYYDNNNLQERKHLQLPPTQLYQGRMVRRRWRNGKISQTGEGRINISADNTIDVHHQFVMPGIMNAHTSYHECSSRLCRQGWCTSSINSRNRNDVRHS